MVGLARAASLLLGMRELDATTADQWGILTELCDPADLDSRVRALAEKLATSPRSAVRGTKASLDLLVTRQVNADDLTRAQELRATAAASPERKEALDRRRRKK
jgi:enoyl-CoA hydratase/carnithine racemase